RCGGNRRASPPSPCVSGLSRPHRRGRRARRTESLAGSLPSLQYAGKAGEARPGAGASRVDPPPRALRALAAATSRHADAPRMAAHAVATASASSTAGGRLAVASTQGVRDATELGERATAGTYGRRAPGASPRPGGPTP